MQNKLLLYEEVKALARIKRVQYDITSTSPLNLRKIRSIYKTEGIKIYNSDKRLKNLRAAYFSGPYGTDVLVNKYLPKEAKIFSLVHELKHHYLDKEYLDEIPCLKKYTDEPEIEISAELFAAEFIWPELEFASSLKNFGITDNNCSPELIVKFKKELKVPVSYKFVTKRLERLKIIPLNSYKAIQFKKLEYSIYGIPFYLRSRHQVLT